MSESNFLSKLAFGSLLTYSPKGESETSKKSRGWRDHIKRGSVEALKKAADKLQSDLNILPFAGLFKGDVVLVPVPGHAPLSAVDALWVSKRIAEELVLRGLGKSVMACLSRKHSVAKSAYAEKGKRPSVREHYESFEVNRDLTMPQNIVLIDDVITKGATILAAAWAIKSVYHQAQVSAFALLRTMGFVSDVASVLDPCLGEISFEGEDVARRP